MSKKKSEEKSSGDKFDHVGIQEKTLRTIFTLLDSDQDKLLDVDQLRTAIIAMGIPPAPRLIQDIVRSARLDLRTREWISIRSKLSSLIDFEVIQ